MDILTGSTSHQGAFVPELPGGGALKSREIYIGTFLKRKACFIKNKKVTLHKANRRNSFSDI